MRIGHSELEGLRSTSCGWIFFGDHLMDTYSSTQQIVALSTAESEYISITKGAAHALEVRGAMVEFGMTLNVLCETDASAGRAMATRRGLSRVRQLDARLLWLQQLCAEGVVHWWMVAATLTEVGSKILPCTNLEREEYVRDERLVLDLCGNGHCDPNGVVGRTVCESHWSDD